MMRRSRSASRMRSAERSSAIEIDRLDTIIVITFALLAVSHAAPESGAGRGTVATARRPLPDADAEAAERLIAAVVVAEAARAVDAAANGGSFVVAIPGADIAGRARTALAVVGANGLRIAAAPLPLPLRARVGARRRGVRPGLRARMLRGCVRRAMIRIAASMRFRPGVARVARDGGRDGAERAAGQ